MKTETEYLTTKELADRLHRSVEYVSAMKACRYTPAVPALNLHVIDQAIAWLMANPDFRYRTAYPRPNERGAKKRQNNSVRRQKTPPFHKSKNERNVSA